MDDELLFVFILAAEKTSMNIVHLGVLDVDRKVLWVLDCIVVRLSSNDFAISFLLIWFAPFEVSKTTSVITLYTLEHWV